MINEIIINAPDNSGNSYNGAKGTIVKRCKYCGNYSHFSTKICVCGEDI